MPPAKKRRVAAEIAAAKNTLAQQDQNTSHETTTDIMVDDPSHPVDPITSDLQHMHRETTDTLLNDLNLLKNTASGKEREELVLTVSVGLSTLKLLQRQITLRVERHHAAIAKQEREKVESCSLLLQNLQYERNYLQREIEELRGWKAKDLETMACDELGLDVKTLEAEQKMAKDGEGDVPMADAQRRITTPEEAIDAYLFGDEETSKLSHRDPSNHERILAKLEEDAAARSSLVDQLSRSKSELKELQRKREELRGFLLRIPKKLGEMEKMGESLNGFFAGCKGEWFCQDASGASTSIDVENKIQAANRLVCSPSLERTRRFQLAQSNLASPLYVLFVQLSGYIDAWSTVDHLEEAERKTCDLGEFVGGDGMNVVAVPDSSSETGSVEDSASGNRWNVELTISTVNLLPAEIATLLGRTTKAGGECIKIVFSYDSNQGVVRARIASEKNKMREDDLLDNLFPGDDGLVSPNVPLTLLKRQEEVDSDDANSSSRNATCDGDGDNQHGGKPYHWCQVLSGLNFPPPSSRESNGNPFQINVCTKALFRQLLRRIRARRSLSALLDFLGKRGQISNLPIHPAFRRDEVSAHSPQCKAKVVSWVEEKGNGNNGVSYPPTMKRYVATIKRKSSTLKAVVVIDTQNYPAEPPIWSLQNEDGSLTGSASSWGEQHGTLSSLQESNHNQGGGKAPPLFDAALHRIETHVNTDLDQFVSQGVETTYDWILLHQLVDIVSCWDELMSVGEGNGGRGNEDGRRRRRGKDRRLVGFGEQSPFFYYRNGL
eukprot:CCRYP_007135-RA/>CCRYP_007135-RA protein AED:0.27 eAED:0.27 QI:0/-1/0/1/-1/1/1/0/776